MAQASAGVSLLATVALASAGVVFIMWLWRAGANGRVLVPESLHSVPRCG